MQNVHVEMDEIQVLIDSDGKLSALSHFLTVIVIRSSKISSHQNLNTCWHKHQYYEKTEHFAKKYVHNQSSRA